MKRFIRTVGMVLFTKAVNVDEVLRSFCSAAGPWEFMDFLMMTQSSLVKINALIYWLKEELNIYRKSEVALKKEHRILTVWLILTGNIVSYYDEDSVQRKTHYLQIVSFFRGRLTILFLISRMVWRTGEQTTFHPKSYSIHKTCSLQFLASLYPLT